MKIIVAMARNGVIGINNQLTWNLKTDLKWFKEKTLNKTVVMGRKTFESIGSPLKNRKNVVLTRDKNWSHPGVTVVNDIDKIDVNDDVFVIGGAEIYKKMLQKNLIDGIILTLIDHDFDGDAYFPPIPDHFKQICDYGRFEENNITFSFLELENTKKGFK